jgi:acetolactate synthase I/II/III large subunit
MPPGSDPVNQTTSGGDFMADVLNSLGIEYLAINCASSFRGLHEAILNHGNNKPEIITCVHEDIAVHMGQGYAKIAGKPDRDGLSWHGRSAARGNACRIRQVSRKSPDQPAT